MKHGYKIETWGSHIYVGAYEYVGNSRCAVTLRNAMLVRWMAKLTLHTTHGPATHEALIRPRYRDRPMLTPMEAEDSFKDSSTSRRSDSSSLRGGNI